MYTIFKSIMEKPILIGGIMIIAIILIMSLISSISSLGTFLGFNTKENMAIKLERTNTELRDAANLLEKNREEYKLDKEIDSITKNAIAKDAVKIEEIINNERKALEIINTTPTDTANIVVDGDIPNLIKDKPTIATPLALTQKQKVALSILKKRAKSLKGAN